MVVRTAHFKAEQQLDLPVVLLCKFVKLLLALFKGKTTKSVDVTALDVVGKAQNVNTLFYCRKDVFLHCVVWGIVVTVVCVDVQIALGKCFHTTSLARNTPVVNGKNNGVFVDVPLCTLWQNLM